VIQKRYASYDDGIGRKIELGSVHFTDLEAYMLEKGNPDANPSGRQELLENIINDYL
jgi:xylose isomerase